MKRLLALLSLFACVLVASAQSDTIVQRPVWAAYSITSGTSHLADTYISPIKYSGWNVGFQYSRRQAMKFDPHHWVMQLDIDFSASGTKNRAHNATMWQGDILTTWAMMHRWQLPHSFSVGVGPQADLNLGCLYLNRNGNNPASAKASFTFDATAYATWTGSLFRIPLTLRYQASIPVTGIFFAPQYGELYYEIYLGNRSRLVHPAWFGNYFSIRQTITADLQLGHTTALHLGYASGILSSKANDLVTRFITHTAIIGVSGQWLSFSPSSTDRTVKSITATY